MRKLIIDTDTGSDDAVAILMALLSDDIEVLAMTTVSGNAPLELATANCLQTMEITGNIVPVYAGADRPLIRERVHAQNVHGEDGMGDMDLIHPTLKAVEGVHAADAIIDIVEKNPNEVEIVAIGPVTNIALAILKAPDTMKKVKAIWTMGTAGFGPGNTTSVAEFNVYADAEAYRIMMNCGVPIYIGGFDICIGAAAWTVNDMNELLASGNPIAKFAVECNEGLAQFNIRCKGRRFVDLPDAVTMARVLWDDVCDIVPCMGYVCINEPATYGQVVLYDGSPLAGLNGFKDKPFGFAEPNCYVMKNFNAKLYKERLAKLLTK